ncbi:purine and uridine phosphorylase [Elaphomyces granulatus]
MPNLKDYTVGWICAIDTEYVAAQAFLDKEHDQPDELSPHDNNDYTLGEIGGHKVVIAVLPDGEYGTSSATSVARDMLHTFPNIRIGLMVSMGSGAPSHKHDIRLGVQDESFYTTGFLNQPPTALRTAVSGLKAQYTRKGHQLEEAISNVLEKNKRMRREYQRPSADTDRLYQSQVVHPLDSERSCMETFDLYKLVLRPKLTEEDDNPAVHYRLIASANQVMNDAFIRNKLAAEKDVLCFETEAAGLLNHFPCLVIRGICNYADSHKNKEWQGYSAWRLQRSQKISYVASSPSR